MSSINTLSPNTRFGRIYGNSSQSYTQFHHPAYVFSFTQGRSLGFDPNLVSTMIDYIPRQILIPAPMVSCSQTQLR